ncbi:hypothetical protein K9692_004831 [Escherichia coli]|nr:hypothetical protein [Escherichia coli]
MLKLMLAIITVGLFIGLFIWVLYQMVFARHKPVPGATPKAHPSPQHFLPTQQAALSLAYNRKKADIATTLNSRPSVTSARHSRPSAGDEDLIMMYLPHYSGMGLSFLSAVEMERQSEGGGSFVEPDNSSLRHHSSSRSGTGADFPTSSYSPSNSDSGSCDSGDSGD